MYGKTPKMSSPKMPKSDSKKGMPMRGGRTATNMMKKSGRGK